MSQPAIRTTSTWSDRRDPTRYRRLLILLFTTSPADSKPKDAR
jgi:hypothetical protein